MIIGLDVDGVIYPFHEIALDHAKNYHDVPKHFTVRDFFCSGGFMDSSSSNSWSSLRIKNFLDNPVLYDRPPSGNLFKLNVLHKLAENNILVYITSRPKHLTYLTKFWFFKYKLPYSENVFISNHSKLELVKNCKCDIFVEDRTEFLDQLLPLDIDLYLINKPWNIDYDNKVIRLNSLDDLVDMLED